MSFLKEIWIGMHIFPALYSLTPYYKHIHRPITEETILNTHIYMCVKILWNKATKTQRDYRVKQIEKTLKYQDIG